MLLRMGYWYRARVSYVIINKPVTHGDMIKLKWQNYPCNCQLDQTVVYAPEKNAPQERLPFAGTWFVQHSRSILGRQGESGGCEVKKTCQRNPVPLIVSNPRSPCFTIKFWWFQMGSHFQPWKLDDDPLFYQYSTMKFCGVETTNHWIYSFWVVLTCCMRLVLQIMTWFLSDHEYHILIAFRPQV